MKNKIVFLVFGLGIFLGHSQDWKDVPVPADAGEGKVWKLVPGSSDDFNYKFNARNNRSDFGNGKWYNFYHNGWDGPGTTYWKYNHVYVDGGDLVLRVSRWNQKYEHQPVSWAPNKMGKPNAGINAGCVTGNNQVKYPVFVEAKVSVADITLASDVWLLSADDTQEIDIIECYGGDEQGNEFFSEFIHLSHHSFIREPFTDYQPRDVHSWYKQEGVKSWGEHHWNNGDRKYTRVGVNWISPYHFEYYIDGKLVRVLYDKAVANLIDGKWQYAYPSMTKKNLDKDPDTGYQKLNLFSTSDTYSLTDLKAANEASSVSIVDPFRYQGKKGLYKKMDIIINVESQNWHVDAGRTPTTEQLNDSNRDKMKVDWIRVYKPVKNK